ncbi:DnaJ domain-containing protein [Xylaria digitata]|nr:DnaJ domain-containing protein [Xylaria digitata]
MPSMNLYEVLNVPNDADIATIQKAFKELSLKMHPDKANKSTIPPSSETEAEREAREERNHNRFVKIVEARDILTNPAKRREYDDQQRYARKHSTNKATEHNEFRVYSEYTTYSEPSRPSTPNTAGKPEKKRVPYPEQVLKRLEPLDTDLNRTLEVFRSLVPRSRSSSDKEYAEIESEFGHVIRINTLMIDRIKRTGKNAKEHDWAAREAYKTVTEKASSYIPYAQLLISELDSVLNGYDVSFPSEDLYDRIRAAFSVFPSRKNEY